MKWSISLKKSCSENNGKDNNMTAVYCNNCDNYHIWNAFSSNKVSDYLAI